MYDCTLIYTLNRSSLHFSEGHKTSRDDDNEPISFFISLAHYIQNKYKRCSLIKLKVEYNL